MKLMELCTSDGVGGLELYAVKTTLRLQSECALIAVVAANTLCAERLAGSPVKTHFLKRHSKRLPLLSVFKLAALLKREAIDVIHLHWGHDFLLAVLAMKLSGRKIRLVYTRQMRITRPKHDAYHRFLYRHVSCFVTITKALAQQAREFLPLPSDRVEVLYYGVPAAQSLTSAERAELRQQWPGLKPEDFVVVLVGRVSAGKGQHLLVEAVARLRLAGKAISAVIIGPAFDKAYQIELEQRVRDLGLTESIFFHGAHPDPVSILPAFDALVMPSQNETFGLVLAEAMRAGLPVIGSKAGGVPEIIDPGKTGLFCQPDDTQSLEIALLEFIENPQKCQQMAAAGKRFADQQYSLEQHYSRLQQLLFGSTS